MKNSHASRFAAAIFPLIACSILICGSPSARAQQLHDDLKPVEGLVVEPLAQSHSQLLVRIENVVSRPQKHKSWVELYVNGKRIEPERGDQVNPADYVYRLGLASGVYELRAVYKEKSFWNTDDYEVRTHDDKVRIYPSRRTELTITLAKKTNGRPQHKENYFTERSYPLEGKPVTILAAPESTAKSAHSAGVTANARPIRVVPSTGQEQLEPDAELIADRPIKVSAIQRQPSAKQLPAADQELSSKAVSLSRAQSRSIGAPGETVALQINTVPAHADVYVDNKYWGQSPVRVHVDRSQSHAIQISKKGYGEMVKVLDYRDFSAEREIMLIERLEKE